MISNLSSTIVKKLIRENIVQFDQRSDDHIVSAFPAPCAVESTVL